MFGKSNVEPMKMNVVYKVQGDSNVSTKTRNARYVSEETLALESAINSLDSVMDELFLDSEYINEVIDEFYGKNYNKKSYEERVQLFANLALCCNRVFGENIIDDGVKVIESPVNNEPIIISEGQLYMAKTIFEQEYAGLSILSDFIFTLRKHIVMMLVEGAINLEILPSDLKGLARIYFENMAASVLEGSWFNFKSKDDKDYYNQPIVLDSTKKSIEYTFKYMQRLYQKYHKIDREFSFLTNNAMNFFDLKDELNKKRQKIINENRANVKNHDIDLDNYERYLKVTEGDLSLLEDNKFYELFNGSYYVALNVDYDGKLVRRLENISNELVKRVFKDFEISNIVLPKCSFSYDKEKGIMEMIIDDNGKIDTQAVEDSSDILSNVISSISNFARNHGLVRFNNEQEKLDWLDMNKWCNLKQNDFNNQDRAIINDGLNVILTKVSELLEDLHNKIEFAISQSDFLPHGESMIMCDNREANYDYHEFKNGLTKEQVRAGIMRYIRDDLKKLNREGR